MSRYFGDLMTGITAPKKTGWLALCLRIALGGIFIISAVLKIPHQNEFIRIVFGYGLLPYGLAELYGTVLPWIELLLGLALVLGLFPRLTAGLGALVITTFIVAGSYALVTGSSGSGLCGCFGEAMPLSHTHSLILDFLMLAAAGYIMYRPSRWWCLSFSPGRNQVLKAAVTALVLVVLVTTFNPLAATAFSSPAYSGTNETVTAPGQDMAIEPPADRPVFMFFYSESCGYCQEEKPIIDELESEYGDRVTFVRADIADDSDAAVEREIKTIPTMILFTSPSATEEYTRFEGLTQKPVLQDSLDAMLSVACDESAGETASPGCGAAQGSVTVEGQTDTPAMTDTQFGDQISISLIDGKPVFLFFYAEWCHFCQQEQPIVDELESEYGDKILFIRAESSAYPDELVNWGVTGFPSMFLIVDEVGDSYIYQEFGGFTEKEVLAASFDELIETGSLPQEVLRTGYVHHSCSVADCYASCITEKFKFPSAAEVERFMTDAALDCLGAEAGEALQNIYSDLKTGECAYTCVDAESPREMGNCWQCIIGETIGKLPGAGCVVTLWNTLGDLLEPHADCLAECEAPSSMWEKNWGNTCRDFQEEKSQCNGDALTVYGCENCDWVVTNVYICDGGCTQSTAGAVCKDKCKEEWCETDDPCLIGYCLRGKCYYERKPECCPSSCDDGDSCTTDTCDESGTCQHARRPYCCPSGCNDGDRCTRDWCGEAGCQHARLPGCDKPDDNYNLATQETTSDITAAVPDARIAVLENGYATGVLDAIDKSGFEATLVDESLSGIELHSVLVIPSGGLGGLDTSQLFKSRLEQYVANGGLIIAFAQQRDDEFAALPGGELRNIGWDNDQSCHYQSVGMSTYHPMFSGLTTLVASLNVDGFFTAYPNDAEILLTRTVNGMPAMIEYNYGQGTVIATTDFDDTGGGILPTTPDGYRFLHDLFAWASSDNEITTYPTDGAEITIPVTNPGSLVQGTPPQYSAGDIVEITYDITNSANVTADSIVFQVSDPFFDLTPVTVPVDIGPGESSPVTLSFPTTGDAAAGIWNVIYLLHSGDDAIAAGLVGQFTIDYDIDSLSQFQVYLTVNSPSGDIYLDTTYPLTIPPGGTGNVTFPVDASVYLSGIWSARYSVVWGDGSVLESSEERFAISKFSEATDGWVYPGSDILVYVTTPEESPPYFTDVTFTVHALNKGDTDRDITVLYFADDELTQSWAAWRCNTCHYGETCSDPHCIWQPMHVPAGGEAYFDYTHPKVHELGGSAFDVYYYDEDGNNLGYAIRGIQPYYTRVDVSLDTDYEHFLGEPIPLTVTLTTQQAKRALDISANITVTAFGTGEEVETQTLDFHLDANLSGSSSDEKAIMLAAPDALGQYRINLVAFNLENIISGGTSRVINMTNPYTVTGRLDHDDGIYRSGDQLVFETTVRNDGIVASDFDVAVNCPELNLSDAMTLSLGGSENTTLTYTTTIPSYMAPGGHYIRVTVGIGTSSQFYHYDFKVPASNIEMALDAESYTVGENITLIATNSGGVDTTGACSLRLMGITNPVSDTLDLPAGDSGNISVLIPMSTPAGTYTAIAYCTNTKSLFRNTLAVPVYVEGSKLELSLDTITYDAGDTVSVNLTNTGGLGTSAHCEIVLRDGTGFTVYEEDSTRGVSGNESVPLDFTIPDQAAGGNYQLSVKCTDLGNSTVALLKLKLSISGTGAALTSITDKTIYLDTENITIQTDIANSDAPIDGTLNLQIWKAAAESAGITRDWVVRYDDVADTNNSARDMTIDSDGNVYVTGSVWDNESSEDYVTVVFDPEGTRLWYAVYNGGDNGSDTPEAIAVDSGGNVYVTGTSQKLKDGSLSQLQYDCVTVKYDADGVEQWVARYDGPINGSDRGLDIAVDADGDIAVTGYSYSNNSSDYITIKYDPDGTQLWAERYDSDYSMDGANALAIDADGNVYVTGYSYDADYNCDYITIKYGPEGGDPLWVGRYDGGYLYYDEATAIAVDDSGNIYVTGGSYGDNWYLDYATIQYYPDGTQGWDARFDGPLNNEDEAIAITTDADGNVYVTGRTAVSFTMETETTDYDIATIKYDTDGDEEWVAYYSSPETGNSDEPVGIDIDAGGDIYVTGSTMNSDWTHDIVTIKYDGENGDEVWSDIYDGPGSYDDTPVGVAVAESGSFYVAGSSSSWAGNDYVVIKYLQTGVEGGMTEQLVWETDIPISLGALETRDIDTIVNIPTDLPGLTGKMFHRAYLKNTTGQVVAASEPYDFYIVAGDLALTLNTDKDFYRPGETVLISGSIVNSASATDSGTLEITKDGAVIYSVAYSIGAGETYPFSTNTTADSTFVLEGTAGVVTVSDVIDVVPYDVNFDIIAPDVVGLEPFDVSVILENASETDYDITVTLGENVWNIELGAGESLALPTTMSITEDTLLTAVLSGDVIMSAEKLVLMGESAALTVTPDSLYMPGPVRIPFSVNNTGLLDLEFESTFVIDEQTVTETVFAPAGATVNGTAVFDLASGIYSLEYSSPYGSGTAEITVFGEPDFIVSELPENTDLNAGDPTWVFKIKNIGSAGGFIDFGLKVPDWQGRQSGWLEAGEEGEFSFTFTIPEDLEEKSYKAEYDLNGDKGYFSFFVHGPKVTVDASLDKNLYEAGDTAILTLDVTNTSSFDLDLFARVQLGDYETQEPFSLAAGGSTTLQYNVPVDFTSGKLFFGIYMYTGRALYLNALYVYEKQALALWTDRQVYDMGDTVTVYVEPPYDGTLDISGPGYAEQIDLTGPTSLQFTLPGLVTGTYYIEYTFDGVTSRYPIDVRGYSSRFIDFNLDKDTYSAGETIHASGLVEVNQSVEGTARCEVTDYWHHVIDEFEAGVSLAAGENDITIDGVFTGSSGGPHTVVCRLYTDVTGEPLMLASASQAFDVEGIEEPPLPDAGTFHLATEGATVIFDADNSYDLNNDPLQYRWDYENDGAWDTDWSDSPLAYHAWQDDWEGHAKVEVSDGSLSAVAIVGVRVDNTAPMVTAGPDQEVNQGQTVQFSGKFKDYGALDTHDIEWTFGDGATANGTLTPSHAYPDEGVYTVVLTVTDDDGGVGSDNLTVTVGFFNNAPVAVDEAYSTDEDVTLSIDAPGILTNATDADNDGLTAVLVDTTENGDLTLSANGSFAYVPAANFFGTDNFTYTANDGYVDSNVATVTITVNAVNDPPVADAGGPYADANEGTAVSFNGTASYDVDGTIDAYLWDFGNGDNSTAPAPDYTYTDNGTYTVTLTVTDNEGATGMDTTSINILDLGPTAVLTGDTVVDSGQTGNYDASGSTSAPDAIVGYEWDWNYDGMTFVPSGDTGATQSHAWSNNGTYNVGVRVTDDDGSTDIASIQVNISVSVANQAPTADNITVTTSENTPVPITLTGADLDGDALTYSLLTLPTSGNLTGTPPDLTYTPHTDYTGTDNFTYQASDGELDSNIATVTITVNPAGEELTINAGPDQTVDEGDIVHFAGSITPYDSGEDYAISWDFGDGATANGTLTPDHAYADNGDYTVNMTVTRAAVETVYDTLTVTVNNVAPNVDAGSYPPSTIGAAINFDGTFTDPGVADTHTIFWDFGDGASANGTLTPSHAYASAGDYTVILTVTDDDGGVGQDETTVAVTSSESYVPMAEFVINHARIDFKKRPDNGRVFVQGTLQLDLDNGNGVDAGEDVIVTVGPLFESIVMQPRGRKGDIWSYRRPCRGQGDILYMTINWKTGRFTFRMDRADLAGVTNPVTIGVRIGDDYGEQTILMREKKYFWDYDGKYPDHEKIVKAGADRTVNEGEVVHFGGMVLPYYPGQGEEISWDFGDGTTPVTGTLNPDHAYADDGDYTVTLLVTDAAGEIASDTLNVTVKNVAPAVDAGKYPMTVPGDTVHFAGSFTDPGTADTHTINWDFGDGTGDTGTLTPSHTYTAEGTYLVRLTVADDDGGVGEDTASVIIGSTSLVPMAKFNVTYAKLFVQKPPGGDRIVVLGNLRLDLGSGNGVDISEDVIVTVGPLTETITMVEKGFKKNYWQYYIPKHGQGIIQYMTIDWKRGEFEIRMDADDLGDFTNPVTISIQVGDDYGTQTVPIKEKKYYWCYCG